MIAIDVARAYLYQDLDRNLPLLSALAYEPLEALTGVEEAGGLLALAVLVDPDQAPCSLASVMVTADGDDALARLLAQDTWPMPAVWVSTQAERLPVLEQLLSAQHDPARGLFYYVATAAPERPHPLVRALVREDADTLDLTPCALGATPLRNWLWRGWQVFGVVQNGVLLAHALAAFPIGDTEEVAGVFTAPGSRRQGYASAIVAAAIKDIMGRGHRAVYACRKTNLASQRVAQGLGLVPLLETWEIVTQRS